jgi:tetratricopeptide (TPR) repeat protein
MVHPDRRSLAKRIRERRLALGLTQKELAGNDFTRGFISQIENGLIAPSLKSLEIIAQRLGAPVSYFLEKDDSIEPADIMALLRTASELRDQGELEEAEKLARKAHSLAQEKSDTTMLADSLWMLGWILYRKQSHQEAAQILTQASAYFQKAGIPINAVKALNTAGSAWFHANKLPKAVESYRLALKILGESEEDQTERQRVLVNLGLTYTALRQPTLAIPLLEKAVEHARETMDYYRLGDVHNALGISYRHLGRLDESIKSYARAIFIFAGVPDPIRYAHANLNCGIAHRVNNNLEEARICIQKALEIYTDKNERPAIGNAKAELAIVAWQQNNLDEATALLEQAIPELNTMSLKRTKGISLILRGRILNKKGNTAAAIESYKEGLSLLDESDPEAIDACFELGNILLEHGEPGEASIYLAKAAAAYRSRTTDKQQ